MFLKPSTRSARHLLSRPRAPVHKSQLHRTAPLRAFSTTQVANFPTPSSGLPKHEIQYFPDILGALPSQSAEFRRVFQLVLMTIPVGGDIGEEIHTVDQILTFTSGTGLAQVGRTEQKFLNTGPTSLLLYTVYSPAEHKSTTEEEDGIDKVPPRSQRSKEENEGDGLVKGG
ncbi:uncharacterized protein BCR38DRAFT_514962 [Pseudomassariella vexata]|uniref:Uncharacterized protein n=1 Tax=Pseudomassariella vexata TaxID=1141098 RepID=A0A1Y2DY51_9PEZI|nr:uncharacterized protein BCR38DRAFT_514962 [Pseudomassariella vexata]ORY64167.1 hypothetical protein BCR38DRAFT_514962 [Pseudomassariella vexata]